MCSLATHREEKGGRGGKQAQRRSLMLGTVLEASPLPTEWSTTLECRRRKMLGALVDTTGSCKAVRRGRPAEGERRGRAGVTERSRRTQRDQLTVASKTRQRPERWWRNKAKFISLRLVGNSMVNYHENMQPRRTLCTPVFSIFSLFCMSYSHLHSPALS